MRAQATADLAERSAGLVARTGGPWQATSRKTRQHCQHQLYQPKHNAQPKHLHFDGTECVCVHAALPRQAHLRAGCYVGRSATKKQESKSLLDNG
jgi:hypothetical protein